MDLRLLKSKLFLWDWQLRPLVEYGRSGGTRTALELCLDRPRHWGTAIALKHRIDAFGILVLGVEEEAIHVKETCPDGREPRLELDSAVGGINIAIRY